MRIYLKLIIVIALISPSTSYAKIYKWVDDKGKVHYSTIPPLKQDAENTKIRNNTNSAASEPVASELPEALFGKWTTNNMGDEMELSLLRSRHNIRSKKLRKKLDTKSYWFNLYVIKRKRGPTDITTRLISNGEWSLKGKKIIWNHKKIGNNNERNVMAEAYIKKVSKQMLTLVFMNGETIIYKRTYRGIRYRERHMK